MLSPIEIIAICAFLFWLMVKLYIIATGAK